MKGPTKARGFSLIELLVALACGAIVMTAAITAVVNVRQSGAATAVRAQLDRDARVVTDMVGRDLSFFGAGIPGGNCIPGPGVPQCTATDLLPVMRVATASSMVFLGDQPYPNAELNGTMTAVFGANKDGTTDDHIVVSSEVSGTCIPPVTGAPAPFLCNTSQTTFVPGVYTAADNCKESSPNARTCPWGMNKLISGANLVLATTANAGDWHFRQWNGDLENASTPYASLHFVHRPNDVDVFLPFNTRYTFVSQPDRVFWSFEDAAGAACGTPPCRIMRNQCWGDFSSPDVAAFPVEGTSDIHSTFAPANCTAGSQGTGWEQVASNVKSFSLSYLQNPSTPIAAPVATGSLTDIRLVQLDFTLERTVPGTGQILDRTVRQLFFLANRERDAP